MGEHATALGLGLFTLAVAERCNVVGRSDGGVSDCDVADLYVIERAANGSPVALGNLCDAYLGP